MDIIYPSNLSIIFEKSEIFLIEYQRVITD